MLRMRKNSHSHRQVAKAGGAQGAGLTVRCQSRRPPRRQAIVGTAHRTRNEAAAVPRHHNHGALALSAAAAHQHDPISRATHAEYLRFDKYLIEGSIRRWLKSKLIAEPTLSSSVFPPHSV